MAALANAAYTGHTAARARMAVLLRRLVVVASQHKVMKIRFCKRIIFLDYWRRLAPPECEGPLTDQLRLSYHDESP